MEIKKYGGEWEMSKFDYDKFTGGYDVFAVSKEKYTKEQAIEIAKEELRLLNEKEFDLRIGSSYVRHRAGINEDGEPCVGWWIEYRECKRSCPAWVFHRNKQSLDAGYETIHVVINNKGAGE
jgi:hypothetical protein